ANQVPFVDITAVASVQLDKKTLTMKLSDVYTLKATILPDTAINKTILWESSNPAMAKVEDGKVTALSAGTVTITATTNNKKTATCTVTVNPDLTGFTFTPSAGLQEGNPNAAIGAVAGEFSAPIGSAAPFTYALTKGNGTNDADNGSFTVSGTNLNIGSAALKEKVYHVFVRITGSDGQTFDKGIT
ncbi:MAG: Ig-like domain-containing protein, partial [Ruthenibacterium sp.]